MNCPGCGNRIQSTDRFCKYCGRPVVQAAPAPPPAPVQSSTRQCTGCGREVPEGLKFCPYCGKPTPGSAQAPPMQPVPVQTQPAPMTQPAPAPQPAAPAQQATKKRCLGCGREIDIGMKFCPFCGAPDKVQQQAPPAAPTTGTRICPGCGKDISITHDFCPSCGYPKNPRFY